MGKACSGWWHKNSNTNSSNATNENMHGAHMKQEMITITVLCLTGVLLLILLVYCIRRRFDQGDSSDYEASNPEVFKPPPTYDEVMGGNQFPVRQDGQQPNGQCVINVATIGNGQLATPPQPPSYDSLSSPTAVQPQESNNQTTPSGASGAQPASQESSVAQETPAPVPQTGGEVPAQACQEQGAALPV